MIQKTFQASDNLDVMGNVLTITLGASNER